MGPKSLGFSHDKVPFEFLLLNRANYRSLAIHCFSDAKQIRWKGVYCNQRIWISNHIELFSLLNTELVNWLLMPKGHYNLIFLPNHFCFQNGAHIKKKYNNPLYKLASAMPLNVHSSVPICSKQSKANVSGFLLLCQQSSGISLHLACTETLQMCKRNLNCHPLYFQKVIYSFAVSVGICMFTKLYIPFRLEMWHLLARETLFPSIDSLEMMVQTEILV